MAKDEIARIRTGWPPRPAAAPGFFAEGLGAALTTGFGHRLSHDVKG
ncbi:hypothetical protein AB0A76_28985 [Streptomyces exfoliatus]|uniref:Uncharacterized protein n=1 Tax=Streptomyces exfoliatus TaxID=1905 RepID=A0ABV3D5L1_STREX